MSNEIVQIADEIKAHWLEYEELVDPNCEACQAKAEEACQREKDDALTEDRPLVSYHHTRQAMIDAGMSERDFA